MSEISSINSSIYPELINSIPTFPTRSSLVQPVSANYTGEENSPVDLSSYYSDLETSGLLETVAQNVAESAQQLSDVMISALENGMSIQDAVNVNLAFHAYKANCKVAQSTFELRI